jgi:hypothetical protein
MRYVIDDTGFIYQWIKNGLNDREVLTGDFCAGIYKKEKLVCGLIFSCNNPQKDVYLTIYSTTPSWCTRDSLRFILVDTCIGVYNCRRATALTSRKNKRARQFLEKVGFKLEGIQRKARVDGNDNCIYGILKEEILNQRWNKKCQVAEEKAAAAQARQIQRKQQDMRHNILK